MFKSLLFIFFLTFLPDIYKDENYLALIKSIKSHPDNYSFYEKLNIYYSKNYSNLNVNQREEVRQSLIQYGIWSSIRICDQTEAGLQIKLTGKITDENNQPISLARITIFQADSKG